MKQSTGTKAFSFALVACLALTALSCNAAALVTVTVSGHVVVEETGAPLANHEVELWTLKLPLLPLGMGSYVKGTIVRTDEHGAFTLTAKVPRDRPFELRTHNAGTVLGGGVVNLLPEMPMTDVKIVHKVLAASKENHP